VVESHSFCTENGFIHVLVISVMAHFRLVDGFNHDAIYVFIGILRDYHFVADIVFLTVKMESI
jgi:hypothetical protein